MSEKHGCFNCRFQNTKLWKCDLRGFDCGIDNKLRLKTGIEGQGSTCSFWKEGQNLMEEFYRKDKKEKVRFD